MNQFDLLNQALQTLKEGIPDPQHFDQSTLYETLNDQNKKNAIQEIANATDGLSESKTFTEVLTSVAEKLQNNFPYHSPFFIGQMLKPPHPIARLAYQMGLFINPNNHAIDGGIASSDMEKEAVKHIADFLGFETPLGHLTSGGTMANLEALWVCGKVRHNELIVGSAQAHYTHKRISEVLNLPYLSIKNTPEGKMDLDDLESVLNKHKVGTVIVTMGTTALGAIDPLKDIIGLQQQYGFRIHLDAAYGGYFKLAQNLKEEGKEHFSQTHLADSIAIDPHKHGLQPYGCGCILFRDPSVGQLYKHDSPYTYFNSADLHLGEISLECSRAGSSAIALWSTQQYLPNTTNGPFSKMLSSYIDTCQWFYERLNNHSKFFVYCEPELDILVYGLKGQTSSEISEKSKQFFEAAEKHGLYLAILKIPSEMFEKLHPNITIDSPSVSLLRSTFMKDNHAVYKREIHKRLELVSDSFFSM